MKIETLKERIDKTQQNITKKEALIQKMQDRISKNMTKLQKFGFSTKCVEDLDNPWKIDRSNPNWEKAFDLAYSIENANDSIESAQKALSELQKKLEAYQSEMAIIIEKENSRDIKVILEFLEGWKEQVKKYYERHVGDWIVTLQKYYEEDHKFCEWLDNNWSARKDKELMKKMEAPRKEAKSDHAMFNYLDRYMERTCGEYHLNMELLQKDLDEEANMKYDFIVEKTNRIVGQITDASNISIGDKGDMNGFIIGTRGKAKVQTIGAGGWNIQCYHFRTLIHSL